MRSLFLLIGLFFSNIGYAQAPTFDNISDAQLETIVKEFSANFIHTSVTPPTSLGKVFGVEASLIAGVTESPGIQEISRSVDPNSDIEYIPHAWILGGVSVPYGVSVELNILPEFDVEGLKMSHTSVGLKWSITDQFFKSLPFDWALRTSYTRSEISFNQTVSNANFPATSDVSVSYENTMIGADSFFGIDFGIVEPYFGIGVVDTDGQLAGSSTTGTPYSLFDDTTSQEKSSKQTTSRLTLGCQFHLAAFNIGLEYSNVLS
ncbi:MAG: DUF6588 family protein, partial [Pseudomonadota bacterium]